MLYLCVPAAYDTTPVSKHCSGDQHNSRQPVQSSHMMYFKYVHIYTSLSFTQFVDRGLGANIHVRVPTQDGNIITSSGVSAGMDMTMFFIDKIAGPDVAGQVAAFTEYNGQWTNPGADNWASN